jgi:hypothetical protein
MEGTLIGDKSVSVVFDNSKIKRCAGLHGDDEVFAQGIRQSLAGSTRASRKLIDPKSVTGPAD